MLSLLALSICFADTPVEVGGSQVTVLPSPPLAVASPTEGSVYLLTAEHELQRWQREGETWTRTWSRAEPAATGLLLGDGRVWLAKQEVRVEPLEALTATGTVAGTQQPAPVALSGRVLRVDRGTAVLDFGREDGLKVGTELRFLRRETTTSFSGEGTTESERAVGTGTVTRLEEGKALVALGRSSRLAEGDVAEVRAGADVYPVAPERLGGLVEAGVVLRPLLALDTLGVAFVNEAWASYAFSSPWYVEARLSPAGFGWSQDGNPFSLGVIAAGGLDERWFSVGLGGGWSMLNQDVAITRYNEESDAGAGGGDLGFTNVRGAFSLAQQARLGARDGLNVVVRNTFVLVPEYTYDYQDCYWETYDADCVTREQTGSGFAFGGIAMRLSAPVGARTDLFGDWGTGQAGATWVTGGVSTWVRGNGDGGSLGLEVAAGYGQLSGNPDEADVTLRGPLVSAGLRWRAATGR